MNQVTLFNVKKWLLKKKPKAVKIIIIFLFSAIVITFMSRIASTLITPQVECGTAYSGGINHEVYTTGTVQSSGEKPYYIASDILVNEILVTEKQAVKKGEVLLKLDMSDLKDKCSACNNRIAVAEASRAELLNTVRSARQEHNNQINSLKRQIDSLKKKNKEDNTSSEEELVNLKEELRALEAIKVSGANTLEFDQQIEEQRKLKSDYEYFIEKNGKLLAEKDMVIQRILIESGTRTGEQAIFFYSGLEKEYNVVAPVSALDASYVKEGDTAQIYSYELLEDVDAKVSSVKQDAENPGSINVTLTVPSKGFNVGMMAEVSIEQTSATYDYIVPWSAVRSGADNTFYVLVVSTKNTILGEEMVAKKVGIKLEDSNDMECGISSDILSSEDQIIIGSDKNVEAGDSIRLMED